VAHDLGVEISEDQLRHPDIGLDQPEQLLVGRAAVVELGGRHPDAFFVDLAGVGRQPSATDIDGVTGRTHIPDELLTDEHRRDDREVVELTGAQPGLVCDENIAGTAVGEPLQEMMHGGRQRVDVAGSPGDCLGDHPAAVVEHGGRQVSRVPDDRGEGSPHQRCGLLVGGGDQATPEDLELTGTQSHSVTTRTECSASSTLASGGTTKVDPRSATSTGPGPAASARPTTGTSVKPPSSSNHAGRVDGVVGRPGGAGSTSGGWALKLSRHVRSSGSAPSGTRP